MSSLPFFRTHFSLCWEFVIVNMNWQMIQFRQISSMPIANLLFKLWSSERKEKKIRECERFVWKVHFFLYCSWCCCYIWRVCQFFSSHSVRTHLFIIRAVNWKWSNVDTGYYLLLATVPLYFYYIEYHLFYKYWATFCMIERRQICVNFSHCNA